MASSLVGGKKHGFVDLTHENDRCVLARIPTTRVSKYLPTQGCKETGRYLGRYVIKVALQRVGCLPTTCLDSS